MISVVIPCLNEEKSVGICVGKINSVLEENKLVGEVIVVDNGSVDGSVRVARSAGAKVVFEEKKGYGNAYKKGFEYVKGDFVFLGDADDTYDFYEIPRFLEKMKMENADFVVGNRKVILNGAMPFLHRYVGKPMFSLMMRSFFRLKISDSHCGFGVIKREKLFGLNLKSCGMEFASEILIKSKKNGLKIREVPIVYYKRKSGKSKLRTFGDGLRHLRLMKNEFFGLQ